MTQPPASMTVEQLVALIRLSGRFAEAEMRALEDRWQREAGDTGDARRFTRWLVARQYLTEPQANLLVRGQWARRRRQPRCPSRRRRRSAQQPRFSTR